MDPRPAKCPDFSGHLDPVQDVPARGLYILIFRERDLDIKHINIALKAINLNLKIQNFPGRVPSDPPPSMSILITIALLLFFNEDSYRDHFYFLQSDGGGGALRMFS